MPNTNEIRRHARESEDMIVMGGHDPDGLARQCARLARYARLLCDEVDAYEARDRMAGMDPLRREAWMKRARITKAREDAP